MSLLRRISGRLRGTRKTHLTVGAAAPELAPDESGKTWTLDELRGKPFILYFYPMDDTPGCTKESCNFRDALPRLTSAGIPVFGASRDDAASHRAFKQKYNLPFPLLVDADGDLAKRWGVDDGNVARRVTFLVDGGSTVRGVWDPVSVSGHVDAVLAAVKAL